ncbi:MAG: hypothetical protein EA395_07840 [Phormidium sp. GEM2.Bin31]|nr:hypothetical protein [Phormidium sp. BM_Day4_Bin.17]TVR11378.1 MAG: hypothetical protein EA395_07840 [Phormidium sp. GEM2.Bin31]UCJ11104.1 MAG: hypothetical protein JWS08_15030 [Phormidium sp. PBR-2020]
MIATSSLSGGDRVLTDTQPQSQVYKGHLIIPRYSRAWWWATVIDPHGDEVKSRGEGHASQDQAVSEAKRLIDGRSPSM